MKVSQSLPQELIQGHFKEIQIAPQARLSVGSAGSPGGM